MGLGFQSLAADMGLSLPLRIHTDSSAAIGICRRRGLGKVRHIAVGDLWVQERTKNGDFELLKILGTENPGDIFTKFVERPIWDKMLDKLCMVTEDGRPDSAPKIASAVNLVACLTTKRLRRGR